MNSNNSPTDPARWKALEHIFHTACELDPEDREEYLLQACEGDEELLGQARDLLKAGDTGDDILDSAVGDAFESVLKDQEERSNRHKRLGPYRIKDIIGRGGMGTVYLAERDDDQYSQQVAIKLVKSALLDNAAQVRLRAERQILANLDHPNIARLLDGGASEDDEPYLVMEYIDGEPLLDYCDRRRLGIRERLKLFRDICSAVQYAHRNLVVHRDLKPSNILVNSQGIPKLLDFGIAKILDVEQTSYTVALTQENMRMLTPEYSSPEQVRGDPITTASDVYVLGILLYELLTGRKPHTLAGCRYAEILRVVCALEPKLAHVAALEDTGTDPSSELLAQYRSSTPEKLSKRLRGDLDNIIHAAMRKETERRYASALQFAEDVQRHLDGLPVVARPDTWGYRTGKFLQRHAVGVGMAAVVMLMITGFGVNAYLQAQQIALERDKADLTAASLIGLFKHADPSVVRDKNMTLREWLERGSERIQDQLSEQPELQAKITEAIGVRYHNLGAYDEAREPLEQSLSIRLELFGYDDPEVAESLNSLAHTLLRQGEHERAESMLEKAVEINSNQFGPDSPQVAADLHLLGMLYFETGRMRMAEERYLEALGIYVDAFGPLDERVNSVKSDLAHKYQSIGDYERAEQLFREALANDRESLGPDHPQVLVHLGNLANLLLIQGNYSAARPIFEETLERFTLVLGEQHRETVIVQSSYGRLLMKLGEFEEAEVHLRASLTNRIEVFGRNHFQVGAASMFLAEAQQELGKHNAAEKLYRESLDIFADTLPAGHQYVGAAHLGLGSLKSDMGQYGAAVKELNKANFIWKKDLPPDHIYIAKTNMLLGEANVGLRHFNEAEDLLTESWAVIDATRAEKDPLRQKTLEVMTRLYKESGREDLAEVYQAQLGDF